MTFRFFLSLAILISVQPEVEAQTRRTPDLTPQDMARMNRMITGEVSRVLVSRDFATAKDLKDRSTVVLPARDFLASVKYLLPLPPTKAHLMAVVADGRRSHSINLFSYETKTDTINYWDPWGKGSFLQAQHNAAEVNAVPHPTKRRIWQIKSDAMAEVLHSIAVPFNDILKLNAVVPLGSFGGMGDTITTARKTHFFKWFHLEQTDVTELGGGRIAINFRPTSARFRPLVSVWVSVTETGRILAMELVLAEVFVIGSKTRPFAADIAKSFLASASPKRDLSVVGPIVQAFVKLMRSGAQKPIPALQAFLGRRPGIEKRLSTSRLRVFTKKNSNMQRTAHIAIATGR